MSGLEHAVVAVVGVPTALGGHLSGMERTPRGLRSLGLLDRLRARSALAGIEWRDRGDLPIEPGFRSSTGLVEPGHDQEPAPCRAAVHDRRPAAVIAGHQDVGSHAERR